MQDGLYLVVSGFCAAQPTLVRTNGGNGAMWLLRACPKSRARRIVAIFHPPGRSRFINSGLCYGLSSPVWGRCAMRPVKRSFSVVDHVFNDMTSAMSVYLSELNG
jgi:hypothetical protein